MSLRRASYEYPKNGPDRGFGGRLYFSVICSPGNRRGGGSGSPVCHARHQRSIPEGNGEDGEAHLRVVGQLLPADSERRSLRRVLLRESRLPEEAGSRWI